MKLKYFKDQLKDFLDSFRLKFSFLQIMLFDLIFYAAVMPLTYAVASMVNKQGEGINTAMLTQEAIMQASEAELVALTSQIRGLVVGAIVGFGLLAVITLAVWSLTRGLIYSKLLGKKYTSKYFKKSLLLNLVLGLGLLLIIPFIAVLVRTQSVFLVYVAFIIILAAAYLVTLTYIQFTKKNAIFNSIGEGFSFGAKALPRLLLPGLLILIVGFLINKITLRLPSSLYISLIIFVAYMAWARTYFISETKKI
ncbi:hypothetical protein GOV06_02430 [Candidatus Woesearchaeota archaeon]|nr:hypothetical protein [Candidatus Woesearchaeota archaeon]